MKNKTITVALTASLLLSSGFTQALHAEPASNNPPLSENCKKTWATADSLTITVPKILCREEDAYDDAINGFLKRTNSFPGKDSSASAQPKAPESPKSVPTKAPKFPATSKLERPRSVKPRKHVKAQRGKLHGRGKSNLPARHDAHGKKIHIRKALDGTRKNHGSILSASEIRRLIHPGTPARDLSPTQIRELRQLFESLLTEPQTVALLKAIQRAEGGELLMIVGGIRGKSPDCQRRIRRLGTSAHPKEQGLPNRCFLRTSHGLSTAAGLYQIVYYGNWRALHKLYGLKDFTGKSQAIIALELIRSSKVRGGRVGEGLVALMQKNLEKAVRTGTDPWASSPYSRWRGQSSAPLLQYARQELRKLRNVQYAKQEFGKFKRGNNS